MLNYIHGIVAYIFLNIREKIHQLLSSVKKMHTKNWFFFSALRCRIFHKVWTCIFRHARTDRHTDRLTYMLIIALLSTPPPPRGGGEVLASALKKRPASSR